MGCYGQQILQFVVVILEGGHAVPIKEQALCLVANIADGNEARNYIMTNEDVLRKIMNYMLDTRTKLQVRWWLIVNAVRSVLLVLTQRGGFCRNGVNAVETKKPHIVSIWSETDQGIEP